MAVVFQVKLPDMHSVIIFHPINYELYVTHPSNCIIFHIHHDRKRLNKEEPCVPSSFPSGYKED